MFFLTAEFIGSRQIMMEFPDKPDPDQDHLLDTFREIPIMLVEMEWV